jgi:uncharacterized repeat protein (TIGR03803 family)
LVPLLWTISTAPAQAQLLRVLHSFSDAVNQNGYIDGWNPNGDPLVLDTAGNLYGTTASGGPGLNIYLGWENAGTVFRLDTLGNNYTLLYTFKGYDHKDGTGPSGLVMDGAGNLYGTTAFGGNNGGQLSNGGTVFKLDPAGNETLLHSFIKADGAADPNGSLLLSEGNLYGIARGPVFELTTTGAGFKVLFDAGGAGNATPGLARDAAGNIYGTVNAGGTHLVGFVFKNNDRFYSFTGGTSHGLAGTNDGAFPNGRLIIDEFGNLYGTNSSPQTSVDGQLNSAPEPGSFVLVGTVLGCAAVSHLRRKRRGTICRHGDCLDGSTSLAETQPMICRSTG